MVSFSNGRREGSNLSSHVTELPDFRILKPIFVDQLCCFKLGISILSLRTRISGDRSHSYRKDRWRLHFYFCGLPSRAGSHYDSLVTPLGILRVRPILCHMLSSFVIRMFNLSTVSICVIMYKFCGSYMFLLHSMLCCHLHFGL